MMRLHECIFDTLNVNEPYELKDVGFSLWSFGKYNFKKRQFKFRWFFELFNYKVNSLNLSND